MGSVFRFAPGRARRATRVLLAFALLVSLCCPSVAAAAGSAYGYNYARQWTSTATGNPASYYGWAGVSGYMYWATSGYAYSSYASMVCSWMGVKDSTGDWVQAGYTKGSDTQYQGKLYIENMYNDLPTVTFIANATPPYAAPCVIEYSGTSGYWYCTLGAFGRYTKRMTYNSGSPSAGVEALNAGYYNVVPSTYFGSNRSSYNGSTYVLKLRGSAGWETWDESLRAGGTYVFNLNDPPYHYSTGYRYYYFGAWNMW